MINRRFKANRPKITWDTNMKPYWNVIKDIIHNSDIILEILDARMPELSRNEEIETLTKESGKQLILILNKADLVSKKQLAINYEKLRDKFPCFIISTKDKIGTKRLREWLIANGKNKERFKIGVLGYPNTGKSSIINSLSLAKKAPVSSKAGTTHGQHWIKSVANLEIVDSPGVVPLKQEDEARLALIGSKNPEKIHNLDIVLWKIFELFDDKEIIKKLYSIEELESNKVEDIIEAICKKRGFIKKQGLIDETRLAMQVIRDWQQGKLRL
ncbi:50S ribosome-binding GTPase [Candidatus Pacearchaeota archaeon]|nr:50S ribosome-binding GTPase [Candidatus Pacearchaeota archaeon]